MKKLYLQTTDMTFGKRLKTLCEKVETCDEHMTYEDISDIVDYGDILLIEHIPPHGFYDSKAIVAVLTSTDHSNNEYMAAQEGAKGFVSTDAPDAVILQMIKCMSDGEVWITRETTAKIFAAYTKLIANQE